MLTPINCHPYLQNAADPEEVYRGSLKRRRKDDNRRDSFNNVNSTTSAAIYEG